MYSNGERVEVEQKEDFFRFHRPPRTARVDGASNLLTHAVDAIRTQQVDSLLHQVSAATAEHTEAQVLQEFRFSGGGIQSPRGTDTVIRSAGRSTGFTPPANATVFFT